MQRRVVLFCGLLVGVLVIGSVQAADKDAVLEMQLTAELDNVASVNTLEFKGTLYEETENPQGERRTVRGPKPDGSDYAIFDEDIIATETSADIVAYVKGNKMRVDEHITTATMTLKNGKRIRDEHITPGFKMVYLGDKVLYREMGEDLMSATFERSEFMQYRYLFPPGLLYKTGVLNFDETLERMKKITTEIDVDENSRFMFLTKRIEQYGMESENRIILDVDKGRLPIFAGVRRMINGEKRLVSRLAQKLVRCQGVWVAISQSVCFYNYSDSGELTHKSTERFRLDLDSIRINGEISDRLFTSEGLAPEPTRRSTDYSVWPYLSPIMPPEAKPDQP